MRRDGRRPGPRRGRVRLRGGSRSVSIGLWGLRTRAPVPSRRRPAHRRSLVVVDETEEVMGILRYTSTGSL